MMDEVDSGFKPNLTNTPEMLVEVMKSRGAEAAAVIEEKFGDVQHLIHELQTSVSRGIIGIREEVMHRREKFGKNFMPLEPPRPFVEYLFCALKDWVILILFIGALLSVILGAVFPEKCEDQDGLAVAMYEGIGIMSTIVIMILLVAFSDYLKESHFHSLQFKINRERKVKIIRGGIVLDLLASEVVVGDLCLLNKGTLIPADGVVVQVNDLLVNESALTGKKSMVSKEIDPLVFCGTHVVNGSGKMIVLAVGCNTQIYKSNNQSPSSPTTTITFKAVFPDEEDLNINSVSFDHKEDNAMLQQKVNKVEVALGYISIILAVITILVLVIHLSVHTFSTQGKSFEVSLVNEYIRSLIIGFVVLIITVPEALSLVVSSCLAFCVKEMYYDKALVRHVDMLETMGNITNICCNKTGVLTQNRMVVQKSYIGEKVYVSEGDLRQFKSSTPKNMFEDLCKAISVNTSYSAQILEEGEDNIPKQSGDRIDAALLQYLFQFGEYYQSWRDDYPQSKLIKVFEFTPDRKCMSTIINDDHGGYHVYSKGAAEVLLQHCSHVVSINGELKEFTKEDVENLSRDVIDQWQKEGLRILCLTTKYISFEDGEELLKKKESEILSSLTLQGIVGINDPVREQVPYAIGQCQRAGITVRMVTGDNVITATSVAVKCGIINKSDEESYVYDGKEFNSYIHDPDKTINTDRFNTMLPKLCVLARATPLDKYVLVKGMMESHVKSAGEIVAVTGSGANDGPVLRMADVGFTMGVAGTDIAKEASDVILLNDDFSSIVSAIKWGRHIYHTVLKFMQFQFTVCWVAVIVVIFGAGLVGRSPLVATQLLWINLIMDTLACFALTRDTPIDRLMNYKPYGRHKPLISRTLLRNVIGHSVYQLVVIFLLIFKGSDWFDIADGFHSETLCMPTQHASMVFTTFVLMQLFNEINARMLQERNVFLGVYKNFAFLIIWFGQLAMQIAIVELFHSAFHVKGMDLYQWMWCFFLGFSELIWAQIIFTIPKDIIPEAFRCIAVGTPKGRGIAYYRSSSRVEQQDSGVVNSLLSPLDGVLEIVEDCLLE